MKKTERIPRARMTARERELRARLNQLVSSAGLLGGSLSQRAITCGKANCRCARGEKHQALYLVVSSKGKVTQIFIPKRHEKSVRRWVKQYHQVQQNLQQLTREQLRKLRA